ncbi:hypothetical protein SLA2020_473950 [Shorea laevis]
MNSACIFLVQWPEYWSRKIFRYDWGCKITTCPRRTTPLLGGTTLPCIIMEGHGATSVSKGLSEAQYQALSKGLEPPMCVCALLVASIWGVVQRPKTLNKMMDVAIGALDGALHNSTIGGGAS